jgi:hypothetical protein
VTALCVTEQNRAGRPGMIKVAAIQSTQLGTGRVLSWKGCASLRTSRVALNVDAKWSSVFANGAIRFRNEWHFSKAHMTLQ